MDTVKIIFREKHVLWFSAAVCIFHLFLSLTHYFLTVSNLYPLDYALILISLAAWATHLILYRVKPHLGKGFFILAGLFLWYLLSCQVMTDTYGRNWLSYNKDPLYDTLLLFGLVFPLGIFMARKGLGLIVRILVHALVFAWTGFIVYILIHVFQNKIIVTPSGGQIGMSSNIALCLNTHYNTTGVIQLVMVIICLFFIFTVRRPIGLRAAYGISCFVNMVAMVLSNSRTSFVAVLILFAACVFSAVYNAGWEMSLRKKIIIGIAAAALTILLLLLFRSLVFSVHENTTHLKALLSAQSGKPSTDTDSASSARDLTSMGTMKSRIRIWKNALKAMTAGANRFLFGVTPVSVISAITEASNDTIHNVYTHNQFLEVGVALGIPGIVCFILFVVFLAISAYRITIRQNTGLKAWIAVSIVVTLLIANLSEATLMFYRFSSSYPFFLFSGWICGLAAKDKEDKKSRKNQETKKRILQSSL